MNAKRLTPSQMKALRRMACGEHFTAAISPKIAKQLEKRKLAYKVGEHHRHEWQRPVAGAKLWVMQLPKQVREAVAVTTLISAMCPRKK